MARTAGATTNAGFDAGVTGAVTPAPAGRGVATTNPAVFRRDRRLVGDVTPVDDL